VAVNAGAGHPIAAVRRGGAVLRVCLNHGRWGASLTITTGLANRTQHLWSCSFFAAALEPRTGLLVRGAIALGLEFGE
jgi:hypothetical protein